MASADTSIGNAVVGSALERPAPKPDPARIAGDLRALAEIGADPGGGVTRLCFTQEERRAHRQAAGWARDLGLEVRTDAVGNTLATRRGRRPGAPAIAVGSHLDSVPHGGNFDGTVGVAAAIELVRMLDQAGIDTDHPLCVAAFAGEEGARFGEPCIGSKAAVGALQERDLARLRDARGVTLAEAMRGVDLDPAGMASARWGARAVGAYLELHIEQARILETEGQSIGLVDVVSGSTRLRGEVVGRADHSGGTPMDLRRDAMAAAAEIVLAVEALARDPRHRGTRATVGRLDVYPNSTTTIPGRVVFTVDVRDVDSDRQRAAASEILNSAHRICEKRGTGLEVELMADTSPAVLPMWLRDLMGRTCDELGVSFRIMSSGAGHDAGILARMVPSGLIFIPCREGLSHVPEEWTSVADICRGVEVLYHVVLRLDEVLTAWGEA
jgi:allantoate deiminase